MELSTRLVTGGSIRLDEEDAAGDEEDNDDDDDEEDEEDEIEDEATAVFVFCTCTRCSLWRDLVLAFALVFALEFEVNNRVAAAERMATEAPMTATLPYGVLIAAKNELGVEDMIV